MLDELILHIGTHKTGSTSIQRILEQESGLLRSNGIVYPKSFTSPAGHPEMAWSLRKGDNRAIKESAADIASAFKKQAGKEECNRLLLSTEEFWPLPRYGVMRLKELFPAKKYQIVIFFRKQESYLESAYNQHVRMHQLRSSERMFEFFVKFGFAAQMNYQSVMNIWADIFGKQAIRLVTYEAANAVSNGVLRRMLDVLKLEMDPKSEDRLFGHSRYNSSLSPAGILALASINRQNDLDENKHRKILHDLIDVDGQMDRKPCRLLTYYERKAFSERYMPMNARLLKAFGAEEELPHWEWNDVEERKNKFPAREDVQEILDRVAPRFPQVNCALSEYLMAGHEGTLD